MNKHAWARIFALVVATGALLLFAACGGGDDTTTPGIGGNIDTGGNVIPPINTDGGTQYGGQQPPTPPVVDPNINPDPRPGPFNFGKNIFALPLDTNGTGRVTLTTTNGSGARLGFAPGQKVAFVVVNTNMAYLDAHNQANGQFPVLPQSSFSITADLVSKGSSSSPSLAEMQTATAAELGTLDNYQGMPETWEERSPLSIYERAAEANGVVPFASETAVKTTSAIQKGEVRTFINVEREITLPPIVAGPEEPDRDVTELRWPRIYNSQDGRLVAIGAHCLVFLSTEINNGHPDAIQFTEARLNRMAREYDTKIFPTVTTAFGPVESYEEYSVWRDLDRTLELTGDDFGSNGELLIDAPGRVDDALWQENKIIIFIYNGGGEGGFFTWFQPDSEIWQELQEDGYSTEQIEQMLQAGSAIYIGGANFPANDNVWDAAFSVMAHEFQHKLYHDHDLPERNTSFMWFNEGMSMLAIHVAGYTVNSGKIIHWAIDGQLTDYLSNCNQSAIPMDANPYFTNQTQYGSGFLFFLYLYEHYGADLGKKIYEKHDKGESDYIKLIENATEEVFAQTYCKFAIANFIDGIYKDNESDLFDPRFHYSTIDLRGTVNLATGTVVLPGVRTSVFPAGGSYPVTSIDRLVYPWGCDYLVFTNGDGRDLEVTAYTDPGFRMFILPANYDTTLNAAVLTQGVTMNY